MHEVGVMQSALELALDHAARRGASQIHALTLRVGPLSGVEPESLAFVFDVVTRGTIAEGATLTIDRAPLVYRCRDCERVYEAAEPGTPCPTCESPRTRVLGGRELDLASLEVS